MRKTYLAAAASLGALLLASAPASASVTFTLNDVNFLLGGALTGTFTTSDDLSVLEDFSITTTADDYGWFLGDFPGATYTLADADIVGWSPTLGLGATFSSPDAAISLVFAAPLTPDGTLLALSNETVFEWGGGTRFAISGSVSAVPAAPAVPEPATWAMMIGGLGLVGMQMRRRKATVAFA